MQPVDSLESSTAPNRGINQSLTLYYVLFFLSGFPALLYQIVWQRTLFTLYGVNVEAVTMIVTVFMLGLGLGSLAGGRLSARPRLPLLFAFGAIEWSIGLFGALSLRLFHQVGSFTSGSSTATTGLVAFALLLIPTVLMGSTLPLLVEYLVRRTGNVGESVGSLYSVNTLGSGVACFFAALFIMRVSGESGTIRLAAAMNMIVGTAALLLHSRSRSAKTTVPRREGPSGTPSGTGRIPFWIALFLAAAVGFIALAYEIVWYRLYSFASGGRAPVFAKLLAFYLFGIAYGAFAVRDVCRTRLKNDPAQTLRTGANAVMLGSIAAYLLGPVLALLVGHVPLDMTFVFVSIAAALLGAGFPLLSHAAIGPQQEAGRRLSYLYLSNIVGSALGSFVIGFVAMDHLSTRAVSLLLLGLGLSVALILAALARPAGPRIFLACASGACVLLALSSGVLFSSMYERLMSGSYSDVTHFKSLVENRSGVIAVDSNDVVYGGGVYDGRFNTDPLKDTNGIFRAYAIAGLHSNPRQVLIIGLSSGSWAQVLVNHPEVEQVTVVEINPGYLPLIRQHADVSTLLQNPKVHIVVDDGRRWLVSHADRKFDFILMNTTYNWRAHNSNLLSTEFLQLARRHLRPGGILYYNTTSSGRVLATGASEFPYALRIANFLAVSDSPFTLDRSLWESVLRDYKIDGRPVFDPADPVREPQLHQLLNVPETESRVSILGRTKGLRLITDDNMGTEWE